MHEAAERVIPLRDGTLTRADVWTPAGNEPGPAILVRTPYGKRTLFHQSPIDALTAMERGYRFVVQDVRGRGRSHGDFAPFLQEATDGVDTIAWITEQPWSNGSVVMTGPSYVGAVQWLAASLRPPGLVAIAPLNTSPYTGEGWTFTNGVRELGFLTSWVCGALSPEGAGMRDRVSDADADPQLAVQSFPQSQAWFHAEPDSDYWSRTGLTCDQVADIPIPVFSVSGWYDIFVNGALAAWAHRSHSHDTLLVGPWGHDNFFSHLNGDADLGFAGSGESVDLGSRILDFFDDVLNGREPVRPRVALYELGTKRWATSDSWPIIGRATATLSIPEATFTVNLDDLPCLAGLRGLRVGCIRDGWGPRDVTRLLDRPDVAVIDLPLLEDDLTVSGTITARIACGSAATPGEQWVALLCERVSSGVVMAIADGVAMRSLDDQKLDIPLGALRSTIAAGASLVLLLCGGLTPRWESPRGGHGERAVGPSSLLTLEVSAPEPPPTRPGIEHSHN